MKTYLVTYQATQNGPSIFAGRFDAKTPMKALQVAGAFLVRNGVSFVAIRADTAGGVL